MFQETRAIVLRTVRHRDDRTILKAYTERFGLRGYVVRTGKRSGHALLRPLERLILVVDERGERDLHLMRELRLDRPYQNMPDDMRRTSVLLFLQELLFRSLQEETADTELYAFLDRSLDLLDTTADVEHYPLHFLIAFARRSGFGPEPPVRGEDHFDLREGVFAPGPMIEHADVIPPRLAMVLARLLAQDGAAQRLAPANRRELFDVLLRYFRVHVPGLGDLRSPQVLHQVMG
ncbi:MAG: DNA repair protein RecO C-terminal domain-containing protein [Flavobacteriales bacterium]|nr:DNA repair protein RecO C-terminal domain-containing protein [Flavobacteriales bacterium]